MSSLPTMLQCFERVGLGYFRQDMLNFSYLQLNMWNSSPAVLQNTLMV